MEIFVNCIAFYDVLQIFNLILGILMDQLYVEYIDAIIFHINCYILSSGEFIVRI